ncbi:MAG TPA: glycerol-3-phosphate dehydrogenase/oxidase [Microbacteriaceae bacterium]|nr:glycerol-3-phosphate dehydrogenase/oxidase [Microbacteriaceae bacterium]
MAVPGAGRLGPAERDAAIARLRDEPLDLLVVGGGIVGVGTVLDAATRGLASGLIEQRDLASGTSSRSSKLVHGGIRYLEQLDFPLVREALVERGLLLQEVAPHLVRPIRFLYPLKTPLFERLYIGAGMMLYDLFSWTGGRPPGVPHHRHLTRRQLARAMPSLKRDAFVGGLVYYDGQVDDARLVATVARTAASYGASIASRVKAERFLVEDGAVVGVEARDLETGEVFPIHARRVVNATGVWTDETLRGVGADTAIRVRASKGVHLVIPREKFRSKIGLLLRTEKSVLFVIPWGRHWLIGTTDTEWELDLAHPAATAADIDYLLDHVNAVLETPLTRDDIEGVYAGLRPLLAGESDETSKLSREHLVVHPMPGLVAIGGGKLTTYRVMGKDAVDAAVVGIAGAPASVTVAIPLIGAEGYAAARNRRGRLARTSGLAVEQIDHLLGRYGALVDDLVDLVVARPTLGEPLPGTEYLGAEVVYAVTHEGALHLDDVLTRRTRISVETWDRGVAAAPVAAAIMAEALGWDAERADREVAAYLERVAAERASQLQPDDESAERVRMTARDVFGR